MATCALDAAELREWFDYNPETGALAWRKSPHPRFQVGQEVGTISGGYRTVVFHGRRLQAHRIIWCMVTGADVPADKHIDHINCQGSDNRWPNLRLADFSQSSANCRARKRELPKGVSTHRKRNRTVGYRAFVGDGAGGARYLGLFATPAAAYAAYRLAAEQQFGEFARFA